MTTTPEPQRRSPARYFRWSQARHGSARSNRPPHPQSPHRSSPFDPHRHLNDAPFISTQVNHRRNQSRCPHAKSPPAAIKSPRARGTAIRSPIAVSSPGGFRTPAAGVRGTAGRGRHPKPFTVRDAATCRRRRQVSPKAAMAARFQSRVTARARWGRPPPRGAAPAALPARCVPKSPAINHAPIVRLAIVNVPAECTAITHWVGHDPRIRIVDHELTAEHQMISKRLFRISRDRSGGDN